MQKLLNYQRSFYKALFTNDPLLLQNSIGHIKDFEDRFRIYSNNVFVSLKKVLKEDFPLCQKILGEKRFNQAAFDYVRNFPPTSGRLLEYGQKFPGFLEVIFPDLPYIKDVAQLEWAKKEIYYTRDTCPLDSTTINAIPADQYPSLAFEFSKATFFLKSVFSLKELWQEKKVKAPQLMPSYTLIIRPRFQIEHYWLSAEEFSFLTTLYEGKTLGEAYEKAATINSEFNLAETLGCAFTRDYFTKAEVSYENRFPI